MLQVKMGVCAKPSLTEAEDLVGGNAGFFWLLDGATPPVGELNHEHTRVFVEKMNEALLKYSIEVSSPRELFTCALREVQQSFFAQLLGNCEHLPYSTAIIVKVLGEYVDYVVLGDSFLGLGVGEDTSVVCDDRLKNIAVEERLAVRKLREMGVDENSQQYLFARKKLIETEKKLQNCEGGYWVAGSNVEAVKHSIEGRIKIKPGNTIITLVSDGLERLVSIFEMYGDVCQLGEVLAKEEPNLIFRQLRDLENDERKFKKSISSKHDDASFIVISL